MHSSKAEPRKVRAGKLLDFARPRPSWKYGQMLSQLIPEANNCSLRMNGWTEWIVQTAWILR
jgi:hypothetical protein